MCQEVLVKENGDTVERNCEELREGQCIYGRN